MSSGSHDGGDELNLGPGLGALRATVPMRISGGIARGIPLAVPKGDAVRPATDGLRQSVFSSLGGRVEGAHFLDLFAGSGAYGLEAFSRGAAAGTFVEKNAKAAACLRQNRAAVCRSVGRAEVALRVVEADVLAALRALPSGVDLVFADPPYEMIPDVAPAVFAHLREGLAPALDPLVIFECPGGLELAPEGWVCLKRIGRGARQPSAAIFRLDRS